MENDVYTAQMNMAGQVSNIEDITQHLTQKPLIHCYSFDLNNQNNIINGIPILSGGEQDQHVDASFMNQVTIADNSFVTSQHGRTIVENPSNLIVNNNDFSVPARIGLEENLEAIVPYIFNNWHDTSNSNPLCATFGDNNSYVNKFLKAQESNVGTEFMSYSPIGNMAIIKCC
jgi:hypothetical protein